MKSSEQSQQSETINQDAETAAQAASERSGIQSLAELLAAGEPGDDLESEDTSGDESAASGGSHKKTKLAKFNDLAGATGVDLDALYKLEINLDDSDEPVTVEQLKDSYKQRKDFDLSVIEFEERKTQQENDLTRAKAELQEILQALPKNAVKPEVLEKIRAKTEATVKAERAKVLQVIPEWKDQAKRETDLAAMADHLQGYGFPVNYLQQVVSHQHFRYIRDNMLRERRIREALEKVRSGKPDKSAANKAQAKAPRKGGNLANVRKGSHPNKLAAIFSTVD